MTGISPPFAKFTVLVTRRVLPGCATPHAFVAKVVLSSRFDSPGTSSACFPRRPDSRQPAGVLTDGSVWVAALECRPMQGTAGRNRSGPLAEIVTHEFTT